ncbi:MAG: fasciclin domain-containing protein [Deltaproteobacteria bacterium]|jgi:uncharacterized surface protein with fasciclin (FAS1) repeats|nr:fasciclin domain-containing protein [Deltaproteobacteria bacterium]
MTFVRLLDALEVDHLDEIDHQMLVNALLDHIVTGEVDEAEIGSRARLVTIGRLRLRLDARRAEVNGLPIVSGRIEAGNGTVYVIDGVLLDD